MDFVVRLHLVAEQVKVHFLGHNDNVSIIEEMKLLKSTNLTVLTYWTQIKSELIVNKLNESTVHGKFVFKLNHVMI